MKKILCFLSLVSLIAALTPLAWAEAEGTFSDVSTTHSNTTAIEYLVDQGTLEGYSDGTFKPDATVNRAEIMKMLVAGQGIDPDENTYKDCFPDVTTEWFAKYVCYAKTAGWIDGYPDGNFQPANTVNKVEALKMLINALDLTSYLPTEEVEEGSLFDDTPVTEWYASSLYAAKNLNLLEEENGNFAPADGRTRANLAENIFRALVVQNLFVSEYTEENLEIFLDYETEGCIQARTKTSSEGESEDPSSIDLYMSTSEDGMEFGDPTLFVKAGGVPSITTGTDGNLISVFQWFPDEEVYYNRVAIKTSSDDGTTWTDPQIACFQNYPTTYHTPYDPTITVTEDGYYRMFFTTYELPTDGGEAHFVYGSAISEDGVHFEYEEGTRFSLEDSSIVDGSEVRVGDTWYMMAPLDLQGGFAVEAMSTDGLTFEEIDNNRNEESSWVGNMVNVEGTIYFYGSDPNGIWFSSTENGTEWTDPTHTTIEEGGDPGITLTEEGDYLIIYVGGTPGH